MRRNFTLPELEERLGGLLEGAVHAIMRHDYERLFGENDVAVRRLRNFAKSHDCVASFVDGRILFRKLIKRAEIAAPPE
ncbi:hypothetical protein [Bradyrhizobium viridifuturi]|uniref:hypothetical protein n=1 Tax=Bradyrhizobium viridifuturi TaxID=1654716 RepID=UPI00067F6325|nr:hypothetical protein [Bradyrhizobium viridifuturi]